MLYQLFFRKLKWWVATIISMMVYGNIKKNKLNTTSEGRNITKMSAIIPLVPANKIPEAWHYILETASDTSEMRPFRRYFESTWYPTKFSTLLSCAGPRHRTTNVLEGWHSRVNSCIPKNPNLLLGLPYNRFII